MIYNLCMDINEALIKIKELDSWPKPFEEGAPMWNDPYISAHMLKAHLDENNDKASYRKILREQVTGAIIKKCSLKEGQHVLDLGCGPGLYAQEFAKRGIRYTGVDISSQSLGYAIAHKGEYSDMIEYMKQDYTDQISEDGYDCVTMIWCDFGALSPAKRDEMLENVKGALKPGGSFCFDVYSIGSPFEESQSNWRVEEGGFWNRDICAVLERSKYYDSVGAGLYSALVVTGDKVTPYRVWDKRYLKEELTEVLKRAGFKIMSIKKGGLSGRQKEMFGVFLKT